MLIDTHNHVGYINKDASAVIADMDALGIDKTWLLTWNLRPEEDSAGYHHGCDPRYARADGTHAAIPFPTVVEACRLFPTRFIPGYCPDPWLGNAPQLLEAAVNIHGVRVCGEWSYRMTLDDPRALELFHAAGRLKTPIVLHMDVPTLPDPKTGKPVYQTHWYAGSVDHLERALRACPDAIFIGHGPGFWREISADADTVGPAYPEGPIVPGGKVHRLLDTYPNLWADLSAGSGQNALTRDLGHARKFLGRYQDRLLYARDSFMTSLYPLLKTLDLPQSTLDKITHQNALRLVPC